MQTRTEVLLEVWRIVERRDGDVYKTEYVEDRWVPINLALALGPVPNEPDLFYVAKQEFTTRRTKGDI